MVGDDDGTRNLKDDLEEEKEGAGSGSRLACQLYGFTEEELDFIINYDIKYRMGDELGSQE